MPTVTSLPNSGDGDSSLTRRSGGGRIPAYSGRSLEVGPVIGKGAGVDWSVDRGKGFTQVLIAVEAE